MEIIAQKFDDSRCKEAFEQPTEVIGDEKKKATLESKMMADNIKLKESRGKAQTHSKNIEKLEEQVSERYLRQ